MRYIKLIISSLIGLVGIIFYFVSIPTMNKEALVNLTVEAGNEDLLEDVYFNGYLLNNEHYTFLMNNEEGITTNAGKSYLEKLDAPSDQALSILQEKYPLLIDDLIYDNNISPFYILNSDKYLISGHFRMNETTLYTDTSTVYLSALDKESNEIVEDEVTREHAPDGDYIDIIGLHEEYPVVKILYNTTTWGTNTEGEKSHLTVGEYNFETKNYSETSLINENGSFSGENTNTSLAKNNDIQIINHYGNNVYEGEGTANSYIYNFAEDSFSPLENSPVNYFVGNNNQLFTLENVDDEVFLREFNQTGQEVINEVALNAEFPLDLQGEYPFIIKKIINNQLFVIQTPMPETQGPEIPPSELYVFDIETGENLLFGKFEYDNNSEFDAPQGMIDAIGQMSDF